MDGRISEYGPWAILAGPFLYAAMTIHKSAQKSVPDFNTSTTSTKNDSDHWRNEVDRLSVEIPDVNETASRSDTLVTCVVLLVALLPISILTAACALHAANTLRLHISKSPIWKSMTRPVLILLFSWAVWAAIKPQDWLDCCALALLLLLLAWNMMKHRVSDRNRRVWNIIVYTVPVVLLLLAIWATKTSQTQVCCRRTCSITVYLVPGLLLLASWTMKKLWIEAPRRRFWDIIVCTGLVALVFSALWAMQAAQSQACCSRISVPKVCFPKVCFVPIVLLLAVWAMIELSTWAPRSRIWNITRHAVRLLVLLLFMWMMKTLHTQALCCSVWSQAVYLILDFFSLLTPWLMQGLRVRTHHCRLLDFVVRTVLLPVRVITLPSQHVRYEVQAVEPAGEEPALPPSPTSEEEQMTRDQDSQMKRLLALTKLHKVLFELFRRTSAAGKLRLQHEIAGARRDAHIASTKAAAEYDKLSASTRETLDPNGIYRSAESIQYVVRRVKDRIAKQQQDLEEKAKALKSSSVVEAAVAAARKEAENRTRSLKIEHEDEVSMLEHQMASKQKAIEAREGQLEKVTEAKSNADKLKASLQKQIDDKEAVLRKEAANTENLEKAGRKKDSQLAALESQLTKLQRQVTAFEDSEKLAKHDRNARIQELNKLQEAFKASAATHTEDLTAVQSRANDLATKLNQAGLEKEKSAAGLYIKIEDLEMKFSTAASAFSTQANDRAVEEKRLKNEHDAAIADKDAEARETLKRMASDKEHMENAHVLAIAAKDKEIQILQEHVAGLAAQNASLQQHSLDDMDIESTAEPELQRESDQITTLSNDLAAERAHTLGLAQEIQGLQEQQQNTLVEGRAAIEGLEDKLGQAKQKVAELTNIIQSGNQGMEAMNRTMQLNSRRIKDLEHTIQSKNQELKDVKNELLDAHTEAVCQNDDVELANEEKRKALELSQNQQRDLKMQQAIVKELQDDLKNKEHMLKVTATEHNASEYQAIYADLDRANNLLDEISLAGCDHTAQMVLEALSIANGTFLKVTLVLKEMEPDADDDEVWANIRTELSEAIVGEHLLSSLSIANSNTGSGHPILFKQAQMANVRLRRLIGIIEETDAEARKNHVLGVMVLPRGDEGNDDEGQGHVTGSPEGVEGAIASKKRRSDDGIYSRPSGSSSSLTNKLASQSSGYTSTKTPFGQDPKTFTTGSGFRLDPGHGFGFSFERPEAVEQRPPPEQRIFNLPNESTRPPTNSAQQSADEVYEMDKFDVACRAFDEIAFDGINCGDELWNNATEDDQMDPRAGLDAAGDFESPTTPSNLLDDAGEASHEAALAADALRTEQLIRLREEIDAEDSAAGTGLYERVTPYEDDGTFCDDILNGTRDNYDALEDREYHAMVNSAYQNHIPTDGETNGHSEDDGVAWENDMAGNGLNDFDSDSEWPEGQAAELSGGGDPFTEQRASNVSQEHMNGRKIRMPRPTVYNPNQALIDWSKVSLSDAYIARQSLRNESSRLGQADATERAEPIGELQTPQSPCDSLLDSEDGSEAIAPQTPHSVENIPAATASTGQPPQQHPLREDRDSEQPSLFSPAYPLQSRKRTKFED